MKKIVSLALCAFSIVAFASVCAAATLYSINDPKPGMLNIKSLNAGRLASVDVFSTEKTGTVTLSRVFSCSIMTNAYDTTDIAVTNVTEMSVMSKWNYRTDDGEVFVWCGFTNQPVNHLLWKSDTATLKFCDQEHFMGYDRGWNYTKNGESSANTHLDTVAPSNANEITFAFFNGPILKITDIEIDHVDVSTNIVPAVITNSVTSLKAYDLTVTNEIFSGSCAGHCLHTKPENDVWIFPSDKIVFGGTATGGQLRIVIE